MFRGLLSGDFAEPNPEIRRVRRDRLGDKVRALRLAAPYGSVKAIRLLQLARLTIADVYKKFDINVEAVVRAAQETLAEVAAL